MKHHLLGLAALAAMATACGPRLHVATPGDFGRYAKGPSSRWITPEGVVLRARQVDHEPKATLAFWTEAAARHLERRGYKLRDKRCFRTAKGLDGCRLDLLVPRGAEDWLYMLAIYVEPDRILLVEAGGTFARLHALDAALQQALAGFDPATVPP